MDQYQKKCARTAAYLNPNIKYDSEQTDVFRSPMITELQFARRFGEMIPDHYLEFLSTFLTEIHNIIRECKMGKRTSYTTYPVRCHIVTVFIQFRKKEDDERCESDTIILQEIEVRPCAQDRGISKLIIWQFFKSCEQYKCWFMVDGPLKPTQLILTGINNRFQNSFSYPPERSSKSLPPEGFKYFSGIHSHSIISLNDLLQMRPNHLKIQHMLRSSASNHILLLNPDAFPTADEMNYGPKRKRDQVE